MTRGATIFPLAPLQEVETFSKPGTADVTPGDRKKLSGLLKHYAKEAHPFTACKRDQVKHGLSDDHANRRCAVIKALIRPSASSAVKEEDRDLAVQIVSEAAELLAAAAKVFEAASWMLPPAARAPGFKPIKPEKASSSSSSSSSEFNKKHPRGSGSQGGQFIRKGASNQAVTGVQKKLGIKTTGTFGGNTIQAVKKYQREHGLVVDGIVGAQTASSLLGKSAMKPGAMSTGLRHALKKLGAGGKLTEGELEERTVHVETREDEPGVKIATISKIRSALYDLSEPRNPTHTVQLPKGTKITVKPGMPPRTYSSFSRTFVITSADGETRKEVIGTDDAAEVAKEMDGTPASVSTGSTLKV
jgi:peptidoglycan hydrolase-like protein with peptidoglycan-binding domain